MQRGVPWDIPLELLCPPPPPPPPPGFFAILYYNIYNYICECGENESPTHHPPPPGKYSCIISCCALDWIIFYSTRELFPESDDCTVTMCLNETCFLFVFFGCS